MSIIFGVRERSGEAARADTLSEMGEATKRYAPDGLCVRTQGCVGMAFQAFHTHERSQSEDQPVTDYHCNMLVVDGRLDNHQELQQVLELPRDASDSAIIQSAFARWGRGSFAKLVGDWSLALWSNLNRTLYLARDHAGTRTLYYKHEGERILWSTALETFFVSGVSYQLDPEYVERYLGCQPISTLTPYAGIRAVKPAHYLAIQGANISESSHWNWIATDRIDYKTDLEYEEQFLTLFRRAVQRRTTSGAQILAQLSGGMDSSAIVCTSDMLRREQGHTSPQLVDTLSYFDDSEPNWNEKPFFELVESFRGKRGVHVDVSAQILNLEPPAPDFLLPGADGATAHNENALEAILGIGRYRVILSGIGGDELLGGVPNPAPELAEYLVAGQARLLIQQAFRWSIAKRIHIYRLLLDAAQFALMSICPSRRSSGQPVPWLAAESDRQHRSKHDSWRLRPNEKTVSPAAIDCARSWWSILETQPHLFPRANVRYEFRYPILDRDLVDFLIRIPPSQLVRPGRRRSLMRRSLRSIVPDPILERRRKAYVLRTPLSQITSSADELIERLRSPYLADLPFLKIDTLVESVRSIQGGHVVLWRPLMRAIYLELWLQASMATGRLTF
jgi:asparagine synthase (glutamine-hydrolysing)